MLTLVENSRRYGGFVGFRSFPAVVIVLERLLIVIRPYFFLAEQFFGVALGLSLGSAFFARFFMFALALM